MKKNICIRCFKKYKKKYEEQCMCLKCSIETFEQNDLHIKSIVKELRDTKQENENILTDVNYLFHDVLGFKKIYIVNGETKRKKKANYNIEKYPEGNLYISASIKHKAPEGSYYKYHNLYYTFDFFQYNWDWGFVKNEMQKRKK